MPTINFPSTGLTPNVSTYSVGNRTWKWNGLAWELVPLTAGFTGSQGNIGYTGSKGDVGFTGSLGYTGSKGDVGFTGSLGYTGSKGDQGDIGFTGSKGDIGYTGSKGDLGYTGSKGDIGYTGSKGDIGYTGSLGFTGSQGDLGYTGSKGDTGYVGSKGDTGFVGSQGYTGSKGDIGYSGSKGDTGYVGSEGNLTVTTSATPPSGQQYGDIWIDEASGIQYFWYNDGNSDQWVEFANQGIVGFTGSAGTNGYTGSAGVGYTGSAGVGYTGSTGFTGSSGFTGSAGAGGGGASWQAVKTSAFNATAGEAYFVNTTSAAITATLPASPTLGAEIVFVDYAGTFDTNNLTIARNGNPIQGSATNLTVSIERAGFTLVFVDGTQGWLLKDK